jgi:hypothetical protein
MPGGKIVAEVAPPGTPASSSVVRLRCDCATSAPFAWAVLGAEGVAEVSERAGLRVDLVEDLGGRWAAVIREEP